MHVAPPGQPTSTRLSENQILRTLIGPLQDLQQQQLFKSSNMQNTFWELILLSTGFRSGGDLLKWPSALVGSKQAVLVYS